MRRGHLIIVALLLLLVGCSQRESVSDEVVVPEKTTVVAEAVNDTLPAPTSEGLSLADKRIGIHPTKIEIPNLQVDALIEDVGRLENGQMGVPEDPDNVGWFEPGTQPGAQGNAVMAGHIDSLTGPAIFHELEKLKQGDEVIVHGQDGEAISFIVTGTASYPRNDAPVDDIFGFNYSSGLTLITCTGEFNRQAKTHEERFVVYTELKNQ